MRETTTRFYGQDDATLEPLQGRTVAVVGYGNLGRPVALNLRDSGVRVVVGNVDDGYRAAAREDGFDAGDVADAVAAADVVCLLLPDEVIPAVFEREVAPRLRPGSALCLSSGYVLAYGLVQPPPGVDVLLLAPRMLGEEARRSYVDGTGFLSYVSVEQDATGTGEELLLALALAVGSLRRGAIRLTAEQEATLDLFVEQGVGAYLGTAFQLAFEIGAEAGLPPEALVAELYLSGEMSRVIAAMARLGFYESVRSHGLVATYGGFLGTLGLDRDGMERHFRQVLEQIRSGEFARGLQEQESTGYPIVKAIDEFIAAGNPMSEAETRFKAAVREPDGRPDPDGRPAADGAPSPR